MSMIVLIMCVLRNYKRRTDNYNDPTYGGDQNHADQVSISSCASLRTNKPLQP